MVPAPECAGAVDRAKQLLHEVPRQRTWRQLVSVGARRIDDIETLAQLAAIMAEPKKSAQLRDGVLEALARESLAGGADELLNRLHREILEGTASRHGFSDKDSYGREVLVDC